VVDLESLNPDPDPAFQVNPDQESIRIQGFDEQKLKKKKLEQKLFSYPLASIKGRTSSTSKHEFVNFSLFLWVIFAFLDPDPQHWQGDDRYVKN
jgi:hypothetical protein